MRTVGVIGELTKAVAYHFPAAIDNNPSHDSIFSIDRVVPWWKLHMIPSLCARRLGRWTIHKTSCGCILFDDGLVTEELCISVCSPSFALIFLNRLLCDCHCFIGEPKLEVVFGVICD